MGLKIFLSSRLGEDGLRLKTVSVFRRRAAASAFFDHGAWDTSLCLSGCWPNSTALARAVRCTGCTVSCHQGRRTNYSETSPEVSTVDALSDSTSSGLCYSTASVRHSLCCCCVLHSPPVHPFSFLPLPPSCLLSSGCLHPSAFPTSST